MGRKDRKDEQADAEAVAVVDPPAAPDASDFWAGLFLGLLVGGLVGISVSALTGDVLAALVAVLAAFFGLGGAIPGGSGITKLRLLAFCIGVLIAVPAAVTVRTHGWLAPTLGERVAGYTDAGVSSALAVDLAIYDQTGLRIGALASAEATDGPQNPGYTFSGGTTGDCNRLQKDALATAALRLDAMARADAPWADAGAFGLTLPPAFQEPYADTVHDLLCADNQNDSRTE